MSRNHRLHWKYKNLTIAAIGIVVAIILSRNEALHGFLLHLGGFGYIGAFIAGVMFVSTFTVATSALVLLTLAETLSPIQIGLVAGLGAVVGDMVIFRFIEDDLTSEIVGLYSLVDSRKYLERLLHSQYFNWSLPLIGAVIIASPLPDEMGISLMNLSRMSTTKFIFVSYILNSIGIFLVVSASVVIKP